MDRIRANLKDGGACARPFLVGNRNHRVCFRGGGRPFDVDRTMVGNMSPSDGREESDGFIFTL